MLLDEISYEKPMTLTKDWIRNHKVTSKNNGKDLTCNSLKGLTRTYIISVIVKLVNLIFFGGFHCYATGCTLSDEQRFSYLLRRRASATVGGW